MKKLCLTVITSLLMLLFGYTIVYALTPIELEQRRLELQQKIDEAGKNIENIEVELTRNLEDINELDQEIYEYEEQINEISANLATIEKKIMETEEELAVVQQNYDHQNELLKQRLVYMYEAGSTRYLDVLLNSTSIVDFISRYYLIAEMAEYDKNLLESIGEEKAKIEVINETLKTNQATLKAVKEKQKKIAISLENSKLVKSSYINELTEEELKIQENLDIYESELELVELEILLTAMEGTGAQYVGGTFAWPAPGYYTITSEYGMRFHPVIKVYRLHSGLDIGAPMGSYAIAANDGIVTKSTYSYSYGNMIMIDHGGGISTLYAHGSERIAQVGDVVKRGDAIMKVGSTGWSTGPHLHFEIIINGQTIDPYPYLISNGKTNE